MSLFRVLLLFRRHNEIFNKFNSKCITHKLLFRNEKQYSFIVGLVSLFNRKMPIFAQKYRVWTGIEEKITVSKFKSAYYGIIKIEFNVFELCVLQTYKYT